MCSTRPKTHDFRIEWENYFIRSKANTNVRINDRKKETPTHITTNCLLNGYWSFGVDCMTIHIHKHKHTDTDTDTYMSNKQLHPYNGKGKKGD